MENTGYGSVSMHSSSAVKAAPPLGHVPPPPPSKPPPYSSFPSSSQASCYSLQYCTSYEQYTSLYQQSLATPTTQSSSSHQPSSSDTKKSPPVNKTVGEVSSSASSYSSDSRCGDSRVSLADSNPPTATVGNTEGEQEVPPPGDLTVAKYKSDEGLKMKFSGGFTSKKRPNSSIAVQLKPQAGLTKKSKVDSSKCSVAQAFGSDSDDEAAEEMPRAAKLRMRNIGKDTPTSAGPNSFNKTSKGFTDQAAMFKKQFSM